MTTPEFTLSHTFNAPRDVLWRAWTDAGQLAQWFGPKGCPLTSCEGNFQPGGLLHYCMRAPDGTEMWGRWVVREVTPPERLVVVASFSDAQAGVTRHPLAADWPLEVLSTTAFAERDGQTTVSLHAVPINATEAEIAMFAGAAAGMRQGWSGTLEQLEAFLARA